MVHMLRSKNKGRSDRPKRSSCHLKMVRKVIRLGAPLRPPINDVDKNGTADNANIVCQTIIPSPSTSHHHNHRRMRMKTPATTQVPNDKDILPPAPNNDATTTNTTTWQYTNDTGSNNAKRGVLPLPTPPIAPGKTEKKSLPVGSHTLPPIITVASATTIIKEKIIDTTPIIAITTQGALFHRVVSG